jgi:hypothetical protein
MIEPLDYKMTDAELETAIADKLLETKDWFAIKGLINKHVLFSTGRDRPVSATDIPQSARAAFLEALEAL